MPGFALLLPLLAAAAPVPEPAKPDAVADRRHYLLVNAADGPVRCMFRAPGGEWSEAFTLERAEQVKPFSGGSEEPGELLCEAPVKQARFKLHPGGRYVLLRDPGEGGEVQLYGLPDS